MATLSNSIEPVAGQPFLAIGGNAELTMSSRQIAELCEKRHDHVLRDIEKMLQDIGDPKFGASSFEAEYVTPQNKRAKEYRLPEDLVITLITGYRADLRYRVVKELEQLRRERDNGGFHIPRNFGEALRLAAEQAEQIESMKEDVAAHGRLVKADGSLCVTDAAKNLGMRPKDLFDWLNANGWIYKRPGSGHWLGYQPRCNSGDLEHKSTTVLKADGSEKITEQVRITAQGLSKLAKLIFPQATLIGGPA